MGHGHESEKQIKLQPGRSFLKYEEIKDMMRNQPTPYGEWPMGVRYNVTPLSHQREPHHKPHKWWNDVGRCAPWDVEPLPWRNPRGGTSPMLKLSNSESAPFATFHNEPHQPLYLGDLPEAPWDRDELHSIYPEIPQNGVLFEHHMESFLKGKPWALFEDGDQHPKDCRSAKTKWPTIIADEDPWNKERLQHQIQPPNIPKLLILPSQKAPYATSHNLNTVVYGEGPTGNYNNPYRLYQRLPQQVKKPCKWPWETAPDWDYHSKLPRKPKSYPHDPTVSNPFAFTNTIGPKARSHIDGFSCTKQTPTLPTRPTMVKQPYELPAAGNYHYVPYIKPWRTYPRDPKSYVPSPIPYAYHPENMVPLKSTHPATPTHSL